MRQNEPLAGAQILAEAFAEDPFWAWVIPQPPDRVPRLARSFGALIEARVAAGDRLVLDPTGGAAALWSPPGAPRDSLAALLRMAPDVVTGAQFGSMRLLLAARRFERARPDTAHGYLQLLGTRPAARGRGLASGLLADLLDGCPHAWIETEAAANVPFYRQFGFEVRRTLTLPSGGPCVYFMERRAPREPVA